MSVATTILLGQSNDVRRTVVRVVLSKARGLITARALDARIASLSDVARFLNRSTSALSRVARFHRA